MDSQLKKGLLEICVLSILAKKDSYGYQIVRDINDYIQISESTLYPVLKRLSNNNFVCTYNVEHNNRLRKYYKITEYGIAYIKEFLNNWNQIEGIYTLAKGGI